MMEATSAASSLLTTVGILLAVWYGDIKRGLETKIAQQRANRDNLFNFAFGPSIFLIVLLILCSFGLFVFSSDVKDAICDYSKGKSLIFPVYFSILAIFVNSLVFIFKMAFKVCRYYFYTNMENDFI